jgi:hypothetical protein
MLGRVMMEGCEMIALEFEYILFGGREDCRHVGVLKLELPMGRDGRLL